MIDRLNAIAHNQLEWLRSLINQASTVSLSSSTLVSTINHHHHHQYHFTSLACKGIQSLNRSTPPHYQALRYHGGKIILEVLIFGIVQLPNSFYLLEKICFFCIRYVFEFQYELNVHKSQVCASMFCMNH